MSLKLKLLVAAFGLLSASSFQLRAQTISTRAGTVKKVEGEVFYRCHNNEKEAGQLQKGFKLHEEDTVLTAESGSAVLALNPDSYLLIAADSFVRIKRTDLDQMHFDIERGEVFVFARSLKGGASSVIHTPPALQTVFKEHSI